MFAKIFSALRPASRKKKEVTFVGDVDNYSAKNQGLLSPQDYALNNLNLKVSNLFKDGDRKEAIQLVHKAVRTASNKENHLSPWIRANAFSNAATYFHYENNNPRAEYYLEKALEVFHNSDESDEIAYATILSGAAVLKAEMGLFNEAERLFRESIKLKEKHLSARHPSFIKTLNNLLDLYKRCMKKPREAKKLEKKNISSTFSAKPWKLGK